MKNRNLKKNSIAAAIDYGGTKILAGLIDIKGKIISKRRIETPKDLRKKNLVSQAAKLLEEMCAELSLNIRDTTGLGISLPGMVDREGKQLIYAPNWKIRNFYIKRDFEKLFNIKTFIANDINAAAVAELMLGHGKKDDSFFWITISTGIGGALVINGKPVTGKSGLAGEIGHIKISGSRLKCGCGKKGCLEAIASGPAILKRTKNRIKSPAFRKATSLHAGNLSTEAIIKAANNKDKGAGLIIDESASAVARALSYVINILDMETIVIGGGVMTDNALMFRLIKKYINEYTYEEKLRKIKLLKPVFRYDSCLIGAASLVFFNKMHTL